MRSAATDCNPVSEDEPGNGAPLYAGGEKGPWKRSPSQVPSASPWGAATKNTPEEELSFIVAAAEDMMYSRKQVRGGSRFNGAVHMILESLFERNRQVRDHSLRIRQFINDFGTWMGLGEEEVACLCSAGLLHDIGMASISDEILNKNGMLTGERTERSSAPSGGGAAGYPCQRETPPCTRGSALPP